MNEQNNKKLVIDAYTALGSGKALIYFEYLSDDVQMTLYGNHKMSRTFHGKKDFLENMVPLFREKLDGTPKLYIRNVMAEGEYVVVEMEGEGRAKDGQHYNNNYCFWVRVQNGKIVETREYMDTQLVKSVFG